MAAIRSTRNRGTDMKKIALIDTGKCYLVASVVSTSFIRNRDQPCVKPKALGAMSPAMPGSPEMSDQAFTPAISSKAGLTIRSSTGGMEGGWNDRSEEFAEPW